MSSMKEVHKAAEASWLASAIPKKLIKHYINLLDYKDDVLELHSLSKDQFKSAFDGAKKDFLVLRDLPIEDVEAGFAEAERWRDQLTQQRTSIASTSSSLSALSIFSQQSSRPTSLASLVSQYSNHAHSTGITQYFCPCGAAFGRSNDLLKHLKNKCEKIDLTRYKCRNCNVVMDSAGQMENHCFGGRSAHGPHSLGWDKFNLPAKKALGCPHCGARVPIPNSELFEEGLNEYHQHLLNHVKVDKVIGPGSPSTRVRAMIRRDHMVWHGDREYDIVEVIERACLRHGLAPGAWRSFTWDEVNAVEFWEALEHGQFDEDDPFCGMGFCDAEEFVAGLVDKANKTGCRRLSENSRQTGMAPSLPSPIDPSPAALLAPVLLFDQTVAALPPPTPKKPSQIPTGRVTPSLAVPFNNLDLQNRPIDVPTPSSSAEFQLCKTVPEKKNKHHLSLDASNHSEAPSAQRSMRYVDTDHDMPSSVYQDPNMFSLDGYLPVSSNDSTVPMSFMHWD